MRRPILLAACLLAARAAAADPLVAVVAAHPGATESAVYLVAPGARELPPPTARLSHPPYAVVRGAALGGGTLALVADRTPSRDLSFAAALYLVAPGAAPAFVCDHVVHASRPLATDYGVVVERGFPGPDPTERGRLREDELALDLVDGSGDLHRLWSGSGYAAHLAAARGPTLYVEHIAADGVRLLSIDLRTGLRSRASRVVAPLSPLARDFSLDDAGRLVYAGFDGARYTVERLDPASGAREILASSTSGHPMPFALGPAVAWNPDGDQGLVLDGSRLRRPAGTDLVRARTKDGAFAAAEHFPSEGALPEPFVLRLADGATLPLPAPTGLRVEVLDFVGGAP